MNKLILILALVSLPSFVVGHSYQDPTIRGLQEQVDTRASRGTVDKLIDWISKIQDKNKKLEARIVELEKKLEKK